MPSEDYKAVSSGALRLKGVDSSSKVHKKKKRPKPDTNDKAEQLAEALKPAITDPSQDETSIANGEKSDPQQGADQGEDGESSVGKTEAEIRYQEMRRKRLNDRLKKEGTKTHKERVEELNRYLNKLSEHHDMPKIGPG